MAQQSARRGRKNQGFPPCFISTLRVMWFRSANSPYGPAAIIAASEAGQMAASDYAPNTPNYRLRCSGRPQMQMASIGSHRDGLNWVGSRHAVCYPLNVFLLLAIVAAAPPIQPAAPLARELKAAVWNDLQMNALIGNGNLLAADWYNAGSDTGPNLHIRDLLCNGSRSVKRCSFRLVRDGGSVEVNGGQVPVTLVCGAAFVRGNDEGGWSVRHTPPLRVGHSQTTMRCTVGRT